MCVGKDLSHAEQGGSWKVGAVWVNLPPQTWGRLGMVASWFHARIQIEEKKGTSGP